MSESDETQDLISHPPCCQFITFCISEHWAATSTSVAKMSNFTLLDEYGRSYSGSTTGPTTAVERKMSFHLHLQSSYQHASFLSLLHNLFHHIVHINVHIITSVVTLIIMQGRAIAPRGRMCLLQLSKSLYFLPLQQCNK